jgi:ribonuclease G
MIDEIIATTAHGPMRIALRDDGRLMELLFEDAGEPGAVGDIIRGRVTTVMKGMEACFVDIGAEKAGFLSFATRGDDDAAPADIPNEGAVVLVQVARAAQGGKGAGLTRSLSLPGRYLVMTPGRRRIAVSRRIEDEDARARLEDMVAGFAGADEGFIVRTAAADATAEALEADASALRTRWREITEGIGNGAVPARVHGEGGGLARVLRDRAHGNIRRVIVDDPRAADAARAFFAEYLPGLERRVELWDGTEPVFEAYGVEDDIGAALEPAVSLPCGGTIVIEHTHALTAVDVNTGRNTGRSNHAATVRETNLEAAREIARQLRLRGIGGLTVIDFVHMDSADDEDDVLDELLDALADDPAFIRTSGFSDLGLVELARRRGAGSLAERLAAMADGDTES